MQEAVNRATLEGRLAYIEEAADQVVAVAGDHPDGHAIPFHRHGRGQLLYALTGLALVTMREGRWLVPPGHAIWLPPGVEHAVEMLGRVRMLSVYVRSGAIGGLPDDLRVVGVTDLARSLIEEAVQLPPTAPPTRRARLVLGLLLEEIPALPRRPLGLPLPSDPRLASLCRGFLANPSPRATIDGWASAAGMSRRTFTRAFHRETGLGLSTWRQQACLFAALPRLAAGEAVTSVALDLGYDSVPAFTTMFKRMLGTTPRAWRGGGG